MLNRNSLSKGIGLHFKSYFENWNTGLAFEAFALANLYLITAHMNVGSADAAMLFYRKHLHFPFLQDLLGKNVGQKVGLQPFGYAFIDFAGTRQGWSRFEDKPHVHALLMIHPDTRQRFDEIKDTTPLFKQHKLALADGDDFEYVASYCLKGVFGVHGAYHGREEYWEVFPRIASTTSRRRSS